MANAETFRIAAKLPSKEINLGGTGTTELNFLGSDGNNLACFIPGSGALQFKPFKIYAAGRVISGSTYNFTVAMYFGPVATLFGATGHTTIATTGAVAAATTQGNWELEWNGVWDNTSQRLCGRISGFVYATAVAVAISGGIATGVDLNTATSSEGQGITITGTFGTGHASNAAYVDVFEVTAR